MAVRGQLVSTFLHLVMGYVDHHHVLVMQVVLPVSSKATQLIV